MARLPYRPAQWRSLGSDVQLLGRRIFAIDLPARGAEDGPPLLCLHGFPTSSHDYGALVEPLGARRRLVLLDLLGFGFSEKPRGPYTIAEQADLVVALLRSLRLDEVDLLCHDMGDTVGCELLARRRASGGGPHWRRVAMLNGGLLPELHRPVLAQRLLRSPMKHAFAKLLSRRAFGRALSGVFAEETRPDAQELDDLFELVSRDGGLANYPALIRYMDERVQHRVRWVGALVALEEPLLLVWGDRDPVAVWPIAQEIGRLRPSTRVVRLEGVGHYPQIEAAQRVAAAVEAHLSSPAGAAHAS